MHIPHRGHAVGRPILNLFLALALALLFAPASHASADPVDPPVTITLEGPASVVTVTPGDPGNSTTLTQTFVIHGLPNTRYLGDASAGRFYTLEEMHNWDLGSSDYGNHAITQAYRFDGVTDGNGDLRVTATGTAVNSLLDGYVGWGITMLMQGASTDHDWPYQQIPPLEGHGTFYVRSNVSVGAAFPSSVGGDIPVSAWVPTLNAPPAPDGTPITYAAHPVVRGPLNEASAADPNRCRHRSCPDPR